MGAVHGAYRADDLVVRPDGDTIAALSAALDALISSDYAPVQGFVLAMAILYVALNLMIDLLYGVIDPRVRLEA